MLQKTEQSESVLFACFNDTLPLYLQTANDCYIVTETVALLFFFFLNINLYSFMCSSVEQVALYT